MSEEGLTFEQWFALNRYEEQHRDMFAIVWNAALDVIRLILLEV